MKKDYCYKCGIFSLIIGALIFIGLYKGVLVFQNPPTYYYLLNDKTKTLHPDGENSRSCDSYGNLTTYKSTGGRGVGITIYIADESGVFIKCETVSSKPPQFFYYLNDPNKELHGNGEDGRYCYNGKVAKFKNGDMNNPQYIYKESGVIYGCKSAYGVN